MKPNRKRRTIIDDGLSNVSQNAHYAEDHIDADFCVACDMFIEDRKKKGVSEYTIKFYRERFSLYRKRYRTIYGREAPRTITLDNIETFVDYHTNVLGNKLSSAQVVLRALKAYCTYLVQQGIEDKNPFDKYRIVKPKMKEVATFSKEQIQRLLAQPKLNTFVGLRDYTMMSLMLDTGIRLRELVDLDVDDVHFSDKYISVKGKNGLYRNVPLSAQLTTTLRRYLKVRGMSPTQAVFISSIDTRYKQRSIQERLVYYGKKANIKNVRVSPHTFRHTFAKMYVQNGGNIFVLQDILGHQTLEMVRVYVRLFSNDLYDDHKRHNPLGNI